MEPSLSLSEIKKRLILLPKNDWLVLMAKPDAVEAGLEDEIVFGSFEKRGFSVPYCKYFSATKTFWKNFYPSDNAWLKNVGLKVLGNNERLGINTKKIIKTIDPLIVGKIMKYYLTTYLHLKKVKIGIITGENIMQEAREICGSTLPENAAPGTIRSFSKDTHEKSFLRSEPVNNLVHCPTPGEMRCNNVISAHDYEALKFFPNIFSFYY